MINTVYNKKYFDEVRAELTPAFNEIKSDLQELADYFYPRSVRFLTKNVNKTNKRRNTKILDSTPIIAVKNFSAGMMTGATSPARRWFKSKIRNFDMESLHDVKIWCASVDNLLRDAFNASNLYNNLPQIYKQLGVFGFGALSLESDYDNIFNSKVLPIGSYKYAKDKNGDIDTFVREYTETAKNLVNKFGLENCSKAVQEAYNKNKLIPFEIVHVVMPNPEYDRDKKWAKNKKFISVYYETTLKENKLLSKSGFDRFPYVVFEAEVNGEDTYPSDCPGINAYPDVKQLMTMTKDYSKAIKKMINPSLKGPVSLKDKKIVDIPSSFTPEDENGRGLSPVYEVNPRVLEFKAEKDDIKQSIKEHFYNDLFAMILNTAERGRTATEVNELKEEKLVLLSPLLEQVHTGLRKLVEWVFYEFMRVGILPHPPEQIQGLDLEIEFVSTLAQAQKAQNIASMERFSTFVINLANVLDPVLKNKINGCKMIDDYADYANVEPSQVNPTEDVEAIRLAQAQEQAQQAQLQAAQQGAEIIKNMGGADAFGSELMQRVGYA